MLASLFLLRQTERGHFFGGAIVLFTDGRLGNKPCSKSVPKVSKLSQSPGTVVKKSLANAFQTVKAAFLGNTLEPRSWTLGIREVVAMQMHFVTTGAVAIAISCEQVES